MESLIFKNLLESNDIKYDNNIETIYFDDNFNKTIHCIIFPDNIKKIVFGRCFNQSLTNVKFPNYLEKLFFSERFNQNIDNVKFPETLYFIYFGNSFNQPIDKVKFPSSLHTMEFGSNFNKPLNSDNINHVNTIKLNQSDNEIPINTLNNNLKSLYIGMLRKPLTNLPVSLKYVTIWSNENDSLEKSKIPLETKVFLEEPEEW